MITNDAELSAAQTELEAVEKQIYKVEQQLKLRRRELSKAISDYRQRQYEQRYGVAIGDHLWVTEAARQVIAGNNSGRCLFEGVVKLLRYDDDDFSIERLNSGMQVGGLPMALLTEMRNTYLERVDNL